MKKSVIIICAIFIFLLVLFYGILKNIQSEERQVYNDNKIFTQYIEKIAYGSDVITVINKAINNNEKNKVQKDENGYYIENNENSIKVFVKLDEKKEYFPMERIVLVGTDLFLKNFSLQDFKCSKIEFHNSTKKISKIYFDVIE